MTGLDPVIFSPAKKMPAASAGMMRKEVIYSFPMDQKIVSPLESSTPSLSVMT